MADNQNTGNQDWKSGHQGQQQPSNPDQQQGSRGQQQKPERHNDPNRTQNTGDEKFKDDRSRGNQRPNQGGGR